MSAERDSVEALLASISDGSPVDWDAIARSANPAERARVDALRQVSRIAEFSRGMQRVAEGTEAPERWGELLLLERIGSGAHAEVYRAWDRGLQREVALKLIRGDVDSSSLLEEGRAAARVRHPNAVTVHGIDRRDDRVGLWMELVRGATLEQLVRTNGPLPPAEVAKLGTEIGSALAAVHAAGLLHRDVTPANVVRDGDGRYVLADFGLGVRWNESATRSLGPSGTPMYMAPELFAGVPATERSDVYSLGLLLWFALAGRHPFEVTTIAELVSAAARGPRPTLREVRPEIPAPLAAIIERAIAPAPEARFANARAMTDSLREWLASPAPKTRSRTPELAFATFAVLIAAAAFGLWRQRHVEDAKPAPIAVAAPVAPALDTYAVEASFLRRDAAGATRLASGDRVKPGDRLSLEVHATKPAWVYVLNEDENGERYLLFPQPRFDVHNPLANDSTFILPGLVGGLENAWTVTSAGGREYFLVVASPAPVAELEAELARLPAPEPGRPIRYARVGGETVERLRGVGGVAELPSGTAAPAPRSHVFDRFRALAGRETDVRGVWVRQIVLENPGR